MESVTVLKEEARLEGGVDRKVDLRGARVDVRGVDSARVEESNG